MTHTISSRPSASLTVADVLLCTRPTGMSLKTWADVLGEALDCAAVWDTAPGLDGWAEGSDGWEDFCDGPDGAVPEPVPSGGQVVGRPATREEFIAAVMTRFPLRGPSRGATLGNVLTAMARYGHPDGSNVYPSNGRIAEEVGVANRATVNRHVRTATDDGWLKVDGKVGRAIKYRLTVPGDV